MINLLAKALTIVSLASLCSLSPAFSQTAYWQQVDGPFTGTVRCSFVTPKGTILLGSEMNSRAEFNYYRSTDSGATWEGRYVEPADPFAHEPRAFLARPNGEIYLLADHLYRSTDDGVTWEFKNVAGGDWLYSLPNGNSYIGSYYGIFESTDGTGTWHPVGPLYTSGVGAGTYAIVRYFASSLDGQFVAVTEGNRLWTSLAGQGWKRSNLRLNTAFSLVLASAGGPTFYLGHRNKVYISSDNGIRFRACKTLAVRKGEYISAISADPSGNLLVGTSQGRAYRMLSTGRTFRVELVLDANSTISSFASNPRSGIQVIGTLDDGVFVKKSPSQPYAHMGLNLAEVWSFARTTGTNLFALSQYTHVCIYRSADGGGRWNALKTQNLGQVALIGGTSKGYLFALNCCGDPIRRSGDNGATWTNITDPALTNNNFYSFFEAANGSIFLGTSGGVFRSADNGATWQIKYPQSTGQVHQSSDGTLFAASNGIIKSTDNGTSWEQANNGLTNIDIRSIASNSRGTIFLATGGGIFRSMDGAANWQQAPDGLIRNDLTQVAVNANDELFVGTGSHPGWYDSTPAGVYTSRDDGATWTNLVTGLRDQSVISMALTSDGHLLAASERGGVYRSTTSASHGNHIEREEEPAQVSAAFSLGQNFPNPFNPVTTFNFMLVDEAIVTVRVYNTLGQEVALLADDEEFTSGTFQLEFDATALPSGVYYYRLTARDRASGAQQYTSMKKMLLMR